MMKTVLWMMLLLAGWASTPAQAVTFDLRLDRLAEAIGLLPEGDRKSVEEVIQLI
ncbi:MAG: hypothetical protein JNL62_09045, partial [Bryobacterales bacterium]|nr:hypothetical protein [Bryobacterales bacterium]